LNQLASRRGILSRGKNSASTGHYRIESEVVNRLAQVVGESFQSQRLKTAVSSDNVCSPMQSVGGSHG
jgi:hypothetical protein